MIGKKSDRNHDNKGKVHGSNQSRNVLFELLRKLITNVVSTAARSQQNMKNLEPLIKCKYDTDITSCDVT